jgi:hypothetical protein
MSEMHAFVPDLSYHDVQAAGRGLRHVAALA